MRPPAFIALSMILAACSVGDGEQPELTDIEVISYNSLAPGALLDNGPALHALAAAPLTGAATELVDSELGRSLLSYIARCALPEGEPLSFSRTDDVPHETHGVLGFAPEWLERPLDDHGERLMTACLMAHVNAFRIQVPISVRTLEKGDASAEEMEEYPAQELTAYGNYFSDDPAARELHVCFGEGVARALGYGGGVGGGLPAYLDLRICSTQDGCGFNRVGACYRWPFIEGIETSACESQSGSFYGSCHEKPIETETTPPWDVMVSVFLQEEHLEQMVDEYREQACGTATAPNLPLARSLVPVAACDVVEN